MQVAGLHIYPLKSAHRVDLEQVAVEARGFRDDRRWMLVDAGGKLVSQREVAKLALIHVDDYRDGLALSCEGHGSLSILVPQDGPACRVKVWGDIVDARAASTDASDWLSEIAGKPVTLVYQPESSLRAVDPRFAAAGDHVSFADGFPVLLTSESSLSDLQARISETIPMTRFRPNLVVRGAEAFAEDGWRRIRVGEVNFRLVKDCDRCVMTTIDQESAVRGQEPLVTLATYRRRSGAVVFGVNAIPDGPGVIRCGDPIVVL